MLSVAQDFIKLFKTSPIAIDNNVFKLHYKLAVATLVTFSIIVNGRQYFGDPIDCAKPGTQLDNLVDTYCWFNSYVLVREEDGAVYSEILKLPLKERRKIQNSLDDSKKKDAYKRKDEYKKVALTYYQWVGFFLLIQAGMFYFPRFLWRYVWEEGRVKELVSGMTSHTYNEDEIKLKQRHVLEYIFKHKGHHSLYLIKFVLCEILNLINVISQIFITDWFLGNSFLNYGMSWLSQDSFEEDIDLFKLPKNRFFPKETQCSIISGGTALGSAQNTEIFCVLPIQIFNEKIYIFLWFFFIILSYLTAFFLIFRFATIFSSRLRMFLLKKRAIVADDDVLKRIASYPIGDWFIIYQIGKNMDPFIFGGLMETLEDKFEEKTPLY